MVLLSNSCRLLRPDTVLISVLQLFRNPFQTLNTHFAGQDEEDKETELFFVMSPSYLYCSEIHHSIKTGFFLMSCV